MNKNNEALILKILQVGGMIFTGIAAACTMIVSGVNAKNEGKTLKTMFKSKRS